MNNNSHIIIGNINNQNKSTALYKSLIAKVKINKLTPKKPT